MTLSGCVAPTEKGVSGSGQEEAMHRKVLSPQCVEDLSGRRVLVVGDLMLDAYLFGDAERISPEAPVPVVRIEEERHLLGGAGNVARNIAALGGKATLLGVTGEDREAVILRSLLDREGITPCLVSASSRPTTVKTRVMARRQQMVRLDREDASPLPKDALLAVLSHFDDLLEEHDIIILSDYAKGIVSPEFMTHVMRRIDLAGREKRLLVDPKPANAPLYQGAFLMTPNTREAGECAGCPVHAREDIVRAGLRLLKDPGCPCLLITLGAEGMALFSGSDEIWHIPTMARDVFDVTGAGDTVIATLGLGLAAGMDLLAACMLANYAAGLVVARVGAATVSPEELAEAIRHLPAPALSRWSACCPA